MKNLLVATAVALLMISCGSKSGNQLIINQTADEVRSHVIDSLYDAGLLEVIPCDEQNGLEIMICHTELWLEYTVSSDDMNVVASSGGRTLGTLADADNIYYRLTHEYADQWGISPEDVAIRVSADITKPLLMSRY